MALGVAVVAATAWWGHRPVAALAYGVAALGLLGRRRVAISLRAFDRAGELSARLALAGAALLPWVQGGLVWRLVLVGVGAVLLERSAAYALVRGCRRRGRLTDRTVIVGTGDVGVLVARAACEHPEFGLDPLGFVDASPPSEGLPLPLLGGTDQLGDLVERRGVRRVLVTFPLEPDELLEGILGACRARGADVCFVPRFRRHGLDLPRAEVDDLWGVPFLAMRPTPSVAARAAKRSFDLVVAGALLVLLAPLLACALVAVRLRLGPSPLFRQRRVTRAGRESSILKLRTLEPGGDPDTCWSIEAGPTGGLARWLRATHVDELPQLVNVLRGDMSLVGPRPERPYFAERFATSVPDYEHRLAMRSGITGWAQVHGLHGDTSMNDRVRFDAQYVETWSIWLDVVILVRTATRAALSMLRRPR